MINITMDATILSSLMSCGLMTHNTFNLDLRPKEGKSNSIECGSIAHAFLEYYYQALIDKKSKSDAMDAGLAAAKLHIDGCPTCISLPIEFLGTPPCGHKNGDWVGVKNTPPDSVKIGKRDIIGWKYVLKTCVEYLSRWSSDSWTPLFSEHTKGAVIYEDSEMRILWKAKFDLIVDSMDSIFPIDHKTMKQRRDSISLNNQFMGQCILTNSRKMLVNKIGFQKSLSPEERFDRQMMNYSKARLDEWRNITVPYWATKLIEYNKTGYWPQNLTHCENKFGFCQYKEACEADPNLRDATLALSFVKGKPWDVTND
jgi:hypothetical protein